MAVGGAGDIGNAIGDYVEMGPTAQWGEDIAEAFLHEHSNPSGAHSAITTTSITNAGNYNQTGGTFAVPNGTVSSAALTMSSSFLVYRNASLNQTANALIPFDTKVYDIGTNFSIGTSLFTVPITGMYKFDSAANYSSGTTGAFSFIMALQKNGVSYITSDYKTSTGLQLSLVGNFPRLSLTIGDTIGLLFDSSTSPVPMGVGSAPITTWFSGYLVSAT